MTTKDLSTSPTHTVFTRPVEVTRLMARRIIETVGSSGAPPEWGFQLFSAGIDPYLRVLDADYLGSYLQDGGSAFKLVVGAYGGGKTHFLYSVRELAWQHGFVVSYVSLSSTESPFHQLERVYGAIARGLMPPLAPEELLGGAEKGLDAFFKRWYAGRHAALSAEGMRGTELRDAIEEEARLSVADVESVNFAFAVKAAASALANERITDYTNVLQWLTAQGFDRGTHGQHGLRQPVDRSQAFTMIRSLVKWVRNLGFAGLVILFDEAEQLPSLSTKQRELMLSNLREIIDECGHASFRSAMILYAVPNEAFFEGRANVYEALKQRIATVFDAFNPTGVKIDLERTQKKPMEVLGHIGEQLAGIYNIAFDAELPAASVQKATSLVAKAAYELRFGDTGYKRLFVQGFVRALHHLRVEPSVRIDADWADNMVQGGGQS